MKPQCTPNYTIPIVTLVVARSPGLPGRVENFTHSMKLFVRLHKIGTRKLAILSMKEGGKNVPEIQSDALNHLLWAGRGLMSFRRINPNTNAHAWNQLKEMAGFPAPKQLHFA